MTTVDDQQRQFQDRIKRVNSKAASVDDLRFKPAPIQNNTRFMFIMAGVVAMFGVISYVTSIVMQAREYAAAAAEAEARAAPVQPKLIKLDSTAQP